MRTRRDFAGCVWCWPGDRGAARAARLFRARRPRRRSRGRPRRRPPRAAAAFFRACAHGFRRRGFLEKLAPRRRRPLGRLSLRPSCARLPRARRRAAREVTRLDECKLAAVRAAQVPGRRLRRRRFHRDDPGEERLDLPSPRFRGRMHPAQRPHAVLARRRHVRQRPPPELPGYRPFAGTLVRLALAALPRSVGSRQGAVVAPLRFRIGRARSVRAAGVGRRRVVGAVATGGGGPMFRLLIGHF